MMKNFTVVIEKDEDNGYIAYVPAIKGCHTQADTLDELIERIKEAIITCYNNDENTSDTQFVGVQNIQVAV